MDQIKLITIPSKHRKKLILYGIILLLLVPLLFPGTLLIPVKNASSNDWNKDTFWHEPWGVSGSHKGIDIFAAKSTEVISPTASIVLYTGEITIGGNIVITLGPRWRIHYFAHLDEINTHIGEILLAGETLGTVGDSGNARGKQPHLHYSHITLLPYVWRIDDSTQGWKKAFYLNPIEYFK